MSEIELTVSGPVSDFTVQQDLEKGGIRVWGDTPNGFFRYRLSHNDNTVLFAVEKTPKNPLVPVIKGNLPVVNATDLSAVWRPSTIERLSLGSHKGQDWDLVTRRCNLSEVLPFWFRLGQLTPQCVKAPYEGTATLLDQCAEVVRAAPKDKVLVPFENLFKAGFCGIMTPRLVDDQHQGFALPQVSVASQLNPSVLLTEGAACIRSIFFKMTGDQIAILPSLPSPFHCGRFLDINCEERGTLSMEWSKKLIRRMVFRSAVDCELTLAFQAEHKSFRLRQGNKDRGQRISCGTPLKFAAHSEYFFDNFQK